MTLQEVIITGRKYRERVGETWRRYSFWTKASDLEYNDGVDGQEKMDNVERSLGLLNQNIKEIKVVTSLPSNASNHPTTLYIITD